MKASSRDRLGSILMLVFVGSLWVQRDYMTRFGGIFPDFVMEITAGILVISLVLSFTRYAPMKDADKPATKALHWTGMIVVGAILLAWAVLLRYLGFILSGILGFGAISWYLGGMRADARDIGRCIAIGAAIVFLIVLIFQRLLDVPLPPGMLFE